MHAYGEIDPPDGAAGDGKLCYVVYHYVDGSSLDKWLRDHPRMPAQSARIVRELCLALDYAHRQEEQVIHRDIKPSNILMERCDADGDKPWITDFGIAITLQDLGAEDSKMGGTPRYRSPEQARGESHRVSPRSDIYSLGVVLYEMLVGREQAAEILDRNLDRKKAHWPLDASVPQPLQHICHRALQYQEADRYQWGRDMADDLQRFLTDGQSVAPPVDDKPALRIPPPGLQRFEAKDQLVFPHLLDSPLDYDGLPESISVWMRRIDEPDPGRTVAVGLIYGPSGCGKSSLLHAGLLPRLPGHRHRSHLGNRSRRRYHRTAVVEAHSGTGARHPP